MAQCGNCKGEGAIECGRCGGTGLDPSKSGMGLSDWIQAVADAVHDVVLGADDCRDCDGNKVIDCPDCGGSGEAGSKDD